MRTRTHPTATPITSTRIELRARRAGPRTILDGLSSGDLVRARPLPAEGATARVTLVQCAASLLAGDQLELDVALEPGARLELVEIAALVVQHARGGDAATLDVRVTLASDARLVWPARPLVIAAGARLRRSLSVALDAGAQLVLRDTLVLGRAGQDPGTLRSSTTVEHLGAPLHVESLDTGDLVLVRSPAVLGGARVLDVVARYGSHGQAEGAMQLAGPGTLLVQAASEAAQTESRAAATVARWRDELLAERDESAVPRSRPGGPAASSRRAAPAP